MGTKLQYLVVPFLRETLGNIHITPCTWALSSQVTYLFISSVNILVHPSFLPRFGWPSSSSFASWYWAQQLKRSGVTSSQTSPVTHNSPVVRTSAMTKLSQSRTSASGCCRSFLSQRPRLSTWAMCCTLSAWRRRGGKGRKSWERLDVTRRTTTLSITMESVTEEEVGRGISHQFVMSTERSGSVGRYWGPTSSTSSSRLCLRWASSWDSTSSTASTWGRSINVAAGPAPILLTVSSPG